MKRNYVYFLFTYLLTFVVSGCDTDIEPEVIQAANTYNEEYYQNLREYKKTDHAICFGWYAGYTSEASPSQGLHFTGLPDSLDIVSLWSGIPSNNPAYVETSYYNERYLPTAYEEMNYIRTVKGTRVVMCTICRIGSTEFPKTDAGIEAYALHLVRCVLRNDLDGLDLDYEPEGDWLQNDNFTKFIKVLGNYFGPQSGTGKLLIVDFYNQLPPKETEPMSIILYDNVTPPVVLKVCNLNLTSLAAGVLLKNSLLRNKWDGTGRMVESNLRKPMEIK